MALVTSVTPGSPIDPHSGTLASIGTWTNGTGAELTVYFQASFPGMSTATAQLCCFKFVHLTAADAVRGARSSWWQKDAAANAETHYYPVQAINVADGEKVQFYFSSDSASDTSITPTVSIFDEAPTATAVAAIQNGLATLTDASAKYAAIIAAISASEVTGYLGRCFSPTLQNELTKDGAGQVVVVPIFKLDPDFDSEHINPATTTLVVWKGGAPIGVGAAAATVWGDIAVSAANPILLNVTIDADDLDTDGMVTIAIGMVDTNGKTALAILISNVVDSTIATNIDSLVAVAPAAPPQTATEALASFTAVEAIALEAAIATYRNITRNGSVLTLSNGKTQTIGVDGISRTLSS